MEVYYPPVAQFNRQGRIEQQNAVASHERAPEVLAVNIDMLQVGQHTKQDLPGAKRFQPGGVEVLLIFKDLRKSLAAVCFIEKPALFVGIDIERFISCKGAAYHEMKRHADAIDVQAQAFANLHIDQRKRQRNAQTSLQHAIEKAILRIVVVDPIAPETLLLEQKSVHSGQHHN